MQVPKNQRAQHEQRPKNHGKPRKLKSQHWPEDAAGPCSLCSTALSEEVEGLAREIAGTGANAEIQELARRVAEAEVDMRRVRHARHRLLSDTLSDPYYESWADTRMKVTFLCRLLRSKDPDIETPELVNFVTTTPQGPQKFALILLQEAKKLRSMDRYERRALVRRTTRTACPMCNSRFGRLSRRLP
jgi:hypothetical protein